MTYTTSIPLPDFSLWNRTGNHRVPFSFVIDVTARCNLNCRHCYINLPAGDPQAKRAELRLEEIEVIAKQVVDMGALWCLISGGEPLLRPDFPGIYMMLKRQGLLVSVFTNATLINSDHVALFKRYPPRSLEVTVYGATHETYENVTRRPGSYEQFRRGLSLLLEAGIPVTLKAMAIQSNVHELLAIAAFCREHTHAPFRFDPFLHLRYDGDPFRNSEIVAERLSPQQIVAIEQADEQRLISIQKQCHNLFQPDMMEVTDEYIFHCGAGLSSFSISYDGYFRLCSSLVCTDCVYDLRSGSLREAWDLFVPAVRRQHSQLPEFLDGCHRCPLINLCSWCPATASLETGRLDTRVEYFCQVAHARYAAHFQSISEG